jgi:hypothetical protein
MDKIDDRKIPASKKSQSLRLEKQTIRTLTGAELRLVGGGGIPCQYASRICGPLSLQKF